MKVETVVRRGDLDTTLISESRTAAMICVGSAGIGTLARMLLGSTVSALAKHAHCPVAIIRAHNDVSGSDDDWIAVVVDDSPDNDAVVQQATEEARLRTAPLLALGVRLSGFGEIPYDQLDRRLAAWLPRYPTVHVHPVAAPDGIAHFLASYDKPVRLLVVGSADAEDVGRLVGAHSHPILGHAESSVLVVRR